MEELNILIELNNNIYLIRIMGCSAIKNYFIDMIEQWFI